MKTVALKDLDEGFRQLVAGLQAGEVVNIVDGSSTIARIERNSLDLAPLSMNSEERQRRHHEFLDFLRSQPARNLGKFNREELYEDEKE
jgi:antitoxin (DNA-binding transcriptional repressor) of toxin-antitoxin stability system